MFCTQEKLRSAVPDGDDDFVTRKKWLKWLIYQSCKSQVPDFYYTRCSDEDIGGLKVPVQDMCGMKVYKAIEQLMDQGLENLRCDLNSKSLRIVMYNLL